MNDIDAFDARTGFAWLCMELAHGYISADLFRVSATRLKIPAADIEAKVGERAT